MGKRILLGLLLMFTLSCTKEDNKYGIKQGEGEVWLSGGLHYCAEQVRLDNGDTLVVKLEEITPFRTGDRVNLKYREMGLNVNCTQYIDSDILEIQKID